VPIKSDSEHFPLEGKLRVYRSRSGGHEWEALTNGLPQRDCYVNVLRDAMAVDSLDSCGVYFGTTGGQVYASADAGDSWAPIVRDLPAVFSVEVQTLSTILVHAPGKAHVVQRLAMQGRTAQRAPMQALGSYQDLQQRPQHDRGDVAPQAPDQSAGVDQPSDRAIDGKNLLGAARGQTVDRKGPRGAMQAALEHRYHVGFERKSGHVKALLHVDDVAQMFAAGTGQTANLRRGDRFGPTIDRAIGRIASRFAVGSGRQHESWRIGIRRIPRLRYVEMKLLC